jgi:hypothetical protein
VSKRADYAANSILVSKYIYYTCTARNIKQNLTQLKPLYILTIVRGIEKQVGKKSKIVDGALRTREIYVALIFTRVYKKLQIGAKHGVSGLGG